MDFLSFELKNAPLAAMVAAGMVTSAALHFGCPGERKSVRSSAGFILAGACLGAFEPIATMAGRGGLGARMVSLALLVTGLGLVRLISLTVFRVVLARAGLEPPRLVQDLTTASGWGLWVVSWLSANQVELGALVAPSAVVTAVLGLSLQDTLGNILGGMVFQVEQSVTVGDWIKVDDMVGRVVEIRWRHTAVETRNWETVIIPNAVLLKSRFQVLGRRQGQPIQWRRWVWFNVDFRTPPNRVIDTVLGALQKAPVATLARNPAPSCVLMDLTESWGRYAVRYWLTDLAVDDPTDSAVRVLIFTALKRAGIPLSIPAHAVFMTKDTRTRRETKDHETIVGRLETLRHLELFHTLTPDELDIVAHEVIPAPFVKGEVITRQGAEAHWLYIVLSGTADVVLESLGEQRVIAQVGPGEFFGEMGLLTGQPRSATVVARENVECLRLEKSAFHEVLHRRPAIAEELSSLLTARSTRTQEQLREMQTREGRATSTEETGLADRIRAFFGLGS